MSRNIKLCHPLLQEKADLLIKKCKEQGLIIKITDCLRNETEQLDCIKRGTSSLKYPNSHHNWGTAFDFCRNDGKGAYNDNDGFFTKVGKIGESIGLEWGGSWKSPVDKPHFQLSNWGTSTVQLKFLYSNPTKFMSTWNDKSEEVDSVDEVIYEHYNDIPDWAKPTISKLIDKKAIASENNLGLTYDMLRVLVIVDRMYSDR